MTNYPYKMQLVVDPDNPRNIVAAGVVSIYDSEDLGKTTLLALTDPNGVPIPNPITSNANGFTPPFVTTSPEVLWVSGPYTDFFQSYQGMRDEAIAARQAAEAAAATAGSEAAAVATAAIGTATDAATAAEANSAASATAAANAAALVGAPADSAVQALINASGSATRTAVKSAIAGEITDTASATRTALNATYASYVNLAKNPDLLVAGAVTVDGNNLVTSAAVVWPNGTPGTLTITSRDANGAVLAYNITYGSPVTKTFTQPTITRNAAGAATNVPQIVVS